MAHHATTITAPPRRPKVVDDAVPRGARGFNFGQMRAFVCVYESGSFSRAAVLENATQSGLTMQVRKLEDRLGVQLFERTPKGVEPTPAGHRYYRRSLALLQDVDTMEREVRDIAEDVAGVVDIGLMPSLTRGALAPVLSRYVQRYPNVHLRIIEAYSHSLIESVVAGELDFAVVPPLEPRAGLATRLIGRDREILLSGRGSPLRHLAPVRLTDLPAMKLVVPLPQNARRRTLETYFATHDVTIDRMLEMDAMIGTLDFVAHSDWMAILPSVICVDEIDRGDGLKLHPIVEPTFTSEFVLVQSARRPLSMGAEQFAAALETELARIGEIWRKAPSEKPARPH